MAKKTKSKPPSASMPKAITLQCRAPITIEAAADGEQPKRPTFQMEAYHGGAMRVSGFYRPVVLDLAGIRARQATSILLDHDASQVVGQSTKVEITRDKIRLSGVITGDDEPAQKVVSHAKNGFVWSASVGVDISKLESVGESAQARANGKVFDGPVLIARAGRLGEVSFVAVGADENASATVAATAARDAEDDEMDFETWLTAKGFAAEDLDETQTKHLRAMYDKAQQAKDGEEKPKEGDGDGSDRVEADGAPGDNGSGNGNGQVTATGADGDMITKLRASAAAETRRINGIRDKCGGKHPKIEAKAIEEGWSVEKCELEVLRASRPKAPALHMVDNTMNGLILEAACMLTARHAEVEKTFDEQTLDAASRRFRGGIGLQELLLEAAWANGYTGRTFRDSRSVMRYAFGRDLQAGFSTIDIGGILSNVTNKFLVEGFFSVERTWRNICATRNVSDFKTVTSYRLIGKDQYELVAPGGELKHGTLGEATYSNKADTHGLILSIDRRDMINDDLGAITTVPRKLGRGSGSKINDVFWSTFMANAAFFLEANKNYLEGADTALGINGLSKAEVAFMNQVDEDDKPIGVMPAIVLVAPALAAMATMLNKSLELRDTTASTKYPVANPHTGKFRTEVSRYLSNAHYAGNSEKVWYLLADPNDLPVIEVAFLNGQESPTIETADADFNVLGVQMRGYHDFGVNLQEPRGGIKVKGEA